MKELIPTNPNTVSRPPPNIFWNPDEPSEAELEEEFQTSMMGEDNQHRFEDFKSYDPDGPPLEAINAAANAFQQSQEEQERYQQFLTDFQESEALVEGSFFGVKPLTIEVPSGFPLEPARHTALEKPPMPQPTSEDTAIQETKVPVRLATNTADRPKAYDTVQWLLKHVPIVHANGSLYFYECGAYVPKRKEDAKRLIMEACRPAVASIGNSRFVNDVYNTLLVEPRICRDTDAFCNIIAFDDCLLDLDTWTVLPHTAELFVTTKLRGNYRHGLHNSCPVFETFLYSISGGDPLLMQRIWEAVGYLLVPDQAGKCFVLFQGVPNSGKTILGNFVRDCFAGKVISKLDIEDLNGNFVLSDLVGKKLCLDLDLPAGRLNKKAISKLKKLTGKDGVSSDVKFADRVNFENTSKFLFATNHAILLSGEDAAFGNRLITIPFAHSIDKAHQDFHLDKKLELERDAIIVKALRHYMGLKRRNYEFAGAFALNAVLDGTADSVTDKIAMFLECDCEVAEEAWTSTEMLFQAFNKKYGTHCEKKDFSKILLQLCEAKNYPVEKGRDRLTPSSNPVQGFSGLKLI